MDAGRPKSTASGYRKVCVCGAVNQWAFSSNGDGSTMQVCVRCGKPYPVGRHYQDYAVGVRLIAFSMLSATFTPKPSNERRT